MAAEDSEPVTRNSRTNFETQLLSRLWLNSKLLSVSDKRGLIRVARKGIASATDECINDYFALLKRTDLREDFQCRTYSTRKQPPGLVSWEHYHWWELLEDIEIWELEHPRPQSIKQVDEAAARHVVHQVALKQQVVDVFSVLRRCGPHRSRDIARILGVDQTLVGNSLQVLKSTFLAEMMPHSTIWQVTEQSSNYMVVVS